MQITTSYNPNQVGNSPSQETNNPGTADLLAGLGQRVQQALERNSLTGATGEQAVQQFSDQDIAQFFNGPGQEHNFVV